MVIVADSGPGVPPEDAERIFEPFFTTKEPGQGTGLGFAIVARSVENAGGTIWVSRSREGGAAFRMLVPGGGRLRADARCGSKGPSWRAPACREDPRRRRRARAATHAHAHPRSRGPRDPIRERPAKARWRRWRRRTRTSILCDVRMPGMDGLTFLDKYKRSAGRALVIMMSAYGDDDAALDAIKRGAYDFIAKPFRADQVLAGRRQGDRARRAASAGRAVAARSWRRSARPRGSWENRRRWRRRSPSRARSRSIRARSSSRARAARARSSSRG